MLSGMKMEFVIGFEDGATLGPRVAQQDLKFSALFKPSVEMG